MSQLVGKTAAFVGASRALGRGILEAFPRAGASAIGIARQPQPLAALAATYPQLRLLAADAEDPVVAGRVLSEPKPAVGALVAGSAPFLRPIHHHTSETFSSNWQTDVRMAFQWVRESLLLPLHQES
jgi:NAD(P)-dependent dehydrogenase (short-subunit alcohol dehydrogenase family)